MSFSCRDMIKSLCDQKTIGGPTVLKVLEKDHGRLSFYSLSLVGKAGAPDVQTGTLKFTKKLVATELLTESDPDSLIFSENWSKLLEIADEEWKPAIQITTSLVVAYRMLTLYGYRAFYIFLKSKFGIHKQLPNTVSDSVSLRSVYEFVEMKYSFSAGSTPTPELFELMKASHPKMPKLIDVLNQYLPAKTDGYKLVIFCESFFGARAVVELLSAHNIFTFKENWSELDSLMEEKCFRGCVIQDKRWVINKFKSSDFDILVSSSFVDNLSAHEIFDCAIGMDYCTASLQYLRYGDKGRHCLLMDQQEQLPSDAFSCDWLQAKRVFCNNTLYRFEKSMNPFEKLGAMSDIPIEYSPSNLVFENKTSKNVGKEKKSVKESGEELKETAVLASIALSESKMRELQDFGIGMNWNWKASGRDIKEWFTYERDPMPELCNHPCLTPWDKWCGYAYSMNNKDEFFNKLKQQFTCDRLLEDLKQNKKTQTEGDVKSTNPEFGEDKVVVKNKRKKNVPFTSADKEKSRKRAKKMANPGLVNEGAQQQVTIINHFQFIRSVFANDFSDPVAETSIDRINALLKILDLCETLM